MILRSRSFEYELASYSQHFIRPPCGNVRSHMISCIHGPLVGVETRLVHQVAKYYGVLMIANIPTHTILEMNLYVVYISFQICDDYNSARHHYEEIDAAKYQVRQQIHYIDYL